MLQQHLPFTVLKLAQSETTVFSTAKTVATAPTVYGIETENLPKVYLKCLSVATAPTVYGIETAYRLFKRCCNTASCNSTYRLRY